MPRSKLIQLRKVFKPLQKLRPKNQSEAENSRFLRLGLKPMPEDASRRELSKSVLRIKKGALCAELRPFYCSIRILVQCRILLFYNTIQLQMPRSKLIIW